MRKIVQSVGVVMVLSGISGVIDHLAYQPFFGIVLNAFNRLVIPRVEFLTGYEIYANLSLSVLGIVIVLAAERAGES